MDLILNERERLAEADTTALIANAKTAVIDILSAGAPKASDRGYWGDREGIKDAEHFINALRAISLWADEEYEHYRNNPSEASGS